MKTDVSKLLKYNDLPFATSMKPGQIIYLESKRRKASVAEHKFRVGETFYDISQLYGIKLKMLYKRNKTAGAIEPKPGTMLKLR